jgi:SAM-dependent methyltransferase
MTSPNYENQWWALIYDQMMHQDLRDDLDNHLRFYRSRLEGVSGAILECACGTGLFLLQLLADGHDMYGFDISAAMLARLRKKAESQGMADFDWRITQQAFETFRYERLFDAVLIPTNSFLMLSTQDAQIRTLRNIAAHLAPAGRLLLDLRLAGPHGQAGGSGEGAGSWHTWTHPDTGRPIRQRMVGQVDFDNQLVVDECTFEYDGQKEAFPMSGRWIFKEEFQLLLRLAGFRQWESYSSPDGAPLKVGLEDVHSYWVVDKA